jgi:uncharacterized membrane protein (UPF0127 family)
MTLLVIMNQTRGRRLGSRIALVETWFGRLRGYLRRPEPQPGEGMLIGPCRAIHMYGLGFPLDVIFIDRAGAVVAIYPRLAPGRRTRWHMRAHYALELPTGTLESTGTRVGDRLVWTPAPDAVVNSGSADSGTAVLTAGPL